MGDRRLALGALLAVLALHLAAGAAYVAWERPNQDEGWYLYAARLVREGQRPYVDFAYVQPPLLPYIYGALGADASVARGRATSLALGALAVLLVGLAGWRAGGVGAVVAATTCGWTPFVISQQSIVKTYALTNLWLAAGLALAVQAAGRRRWLIGAAVAFALAALTRNSAAVALPAYGLWLAGDRDRRAALPPALLAGLATLLLGYAPFLTAGLDPLRYHLLEHHAGNAAQGDLLTRLVVILAVGGLVAQAAPVLTLAAAGGLVAWTRRRPAPLAPEVGLALLLATVVFLGHFVSGHPYQEYQVLALPAAGVVAGLCWGCLPARWRRAGLAVVVGLQMVAVGLAIGGLPGRQFGPGGVHGPLRQVAAQVRRHCPANAELLTFQTDVAVEAHRRLSPGLTLASFSFRGEPGAERYHMVTAASLRRTLEAATPAVVVLSPGDLSNLLHGEWTAADRVRAQPALRGESLATYGPLLAALDRHYRLVARVAGVGQFRETMSVLARRNP